ncbi:MAG: hypothetical protein IK121_06630 [Lachnospiraceae bacterium]|nr:hypothetical protein [Lachnospiraceae bacterium]
MVNRHLYLTVMDGDSAIFQKFRNMSDEISWVKKIDSILRKIRPEMYEEKKEKEVSEKRSGKSEPAKPRERKSIIKLMETKKKELDQRERAERSRGPRIIKKDRDEPSL